VVIITIIIIIIRLLTHSLSKESQVTVLYYLLNAQRMIMMIKKSGKLFFSRL